MQTNYIVFNLIFFPLFLKKKNAQATFEEKPQIKIISIRKQKH